MSGAPVITASTAKRQGEAEVHRLARALWRIVKLGGGRSGPTDDRSRVQRPVPV